MNEYYYLDGKEQKGPYSLAELKSKKLTSETLIWSEEFDEWKRVKDVKELLGEVTVKKMPPPPPSDTIENISKTELSGQIKVSLENTQNPTFDFIKNTRKAFNWLIAWYSFNLFALIMSYSQIEIFNSSGEPDTDKFWPFVKFTSEYRLMNGQRWYGGKGYGDKIEFNGLFVDYDWTEFSVYVIGGLIIFFIIKNQLTNQPDNA